MKFVVEQQKMVNVLGHVTNVLERTPTRHIHSHAGIRAGENGELEIGCTNLSMTMLAKMNLLTTEEPGSAAIPGHRLFEIFRRIPHDASVTFATVDDMVEVSFNRARYTLNVIPGADEDILGYGMRDAPSDHVTVSIKAGLLRSMLLYTNPMMAVRHSTRYLIATCFEVTADYFRLISTQATALVTATTTESRNGRMADGEKERRFLVPRKTVLDITSLLADVGANDDVNIVLGTNHVSVEINNYSIISDLMEGNFPEYGQVFPDPEDWSMECGREELRLAFDQVEVVATDSSHRISCELEDDVLTLVSATTRNDRVNNEIAVNKMTAARKFSINGEKMLRVLSTLRTPRISLISTEGNERANLKIIGQGETRSEGEGEQKPEPIEVCYVLSLLYNT